MGSGVHYGCQEDVSQPVDTEAVEIVFGEIQLKSAFEMPDSSGKLIPSQSRDRSRLSFIIRSCRHLHHLRESCVCKLDSYSCPSSLAPESVSSRAAGDLTSKKDQNTGFSILDSRYSRGSRFEHRASGIKHRVLHFDFFWCFVGESDNFCS